MFYFVQGRTNAQLIDKLLYRSNLSINFALVGHCTK